ncbi:hypothetical protein NDI56_15885 [Haloarcula sp. S1CR25-12]|uniref:Prophage tail endopeptidase domain-containing protein n=1 Tax=Haloarcula saliterrae TaxID=2950534 RepID=A0ABU2FGL4_9EURY|nr:hypothetical protein [Haloarcula sp. S1CR25-12]MDS0260886.1 hypothetical protein [Haloarcula sp. S1CR25-12]
MSTRTFDVGTVSDHEPQGDCDSRIYVNGTRIPVANADVHLRKEGALDVTRYAEVQFPATYQGERYVDLFQTKEPQNQTSFDTLYIELKDSNDTFIPTFRGFVTGVGATDKASTWQCRARGPADLLTSVTAGKQFTSCTGKFVVDYVLSELDENSQFNVTSLSETADDSLEDIEIYDDIESLADFIFPDNDSIPDLAPKTFQENRHTLKDVVDWLRSKNSLRLWFQPTEDGITLLPLKKPTNTSHQAHYLGGDITVIDNNAYAELAPINTIEVKGSATRSKESVGSFELNTGVKKYVIAKARHKGLYQRAGETELHADTFIKSDGQTKAEVKNDARSALKEAIDEATAGDMTTLLAGGLTPFDTIEARPTCRTEAEKTVPLTYEVNRIHHMVSPDDDNSGNISKSRLNIGIHTDMAEDIVIKDSWVDRRKKET